MSRARAYSHARCEAWNMLAGDLHPELGVARKYLARELIHQSALLEETRRSLSTISLPKGD